MKKLISLLIILIFSLEAFANPRTVYFQDPTTKESAWNAAKEYDKLYMSKGVQITTVQTNSKYDHVNEWIYKSSASTLTAKVNYQYFDDRIVVNILEAGLIPDGKAKVTLTKDDANALRKQLYTALEKMIVDSFFTNLNLSETKPTNNIIRKVDTENSFSNDYDFVTRKYAVNQTKEMAKEKNLNYINNVLKPSFQVTFLSDKSSDNFDVKYFKNDEGGIATTIIVNYQFQNNGFIIAINSIEIIKDIDKARVIVNKNSTTDPQKSFYDYMKSYFIDSHANYITPK